MARILIAEDDEPTRALLEKALCNCPHDIKFVGDGTEALLLYGAALRECSPYTALILDCSMPRMSGPDVVRRIRELGDEQVIIVFFTAHGKEVSVEDVTRYRVFDVWEKPAALFDLEQRILKLLAIVETDSTS
jgi:CheY-like chemotaxis protein